MPSEVMGRLEETFKRNSSSSYLAKLTFVKDILGENVPEKLSDVSIYNCHNQEGVCMFLCVYVYYERG